MLSDSTHQFGNTVDFRIVYREYYITLTQSDIVGTAIFNNRGTNVRDAAAVGALAGVTAGALQQNSNKETIIRNCMRQRGYNVVG